MAPIIKPKKGSSSWFYSFYSDVSDYLLDPKKSALVAGLLLLAEIVVNVFVILKVPYTEIDWRAYMQEVEGVLLNGTTDYSELRGETGPLVYPAGFVWFYSALYYVTSRGSDLRTAQFIFAAIYLITLALVFRIMIVTRKVPPYVLLIMSGTSYRIHSIFVLRLFNDPVAMMFLYGAVNLFITGFWSLGSVFFSLAVSVKMNVLLFAPALLLVYSANLGTVKTLFQLLICAGVQVVLAIPFLKSHPLEYLKGAFDLGRIFLFKWTVNWRFLPEELFVSKVFHVALLLCHVAVLLYFSRIWWQMLTSYAKLKGDRSRSLPTEASQLIVLPLFMANFIGVMFARSLHYQFYVWYYHQLHYLAWTTSFSFKFRLLLLGFIELCWNTYPSTIWSSLLLHISHICLLLGLWHYLTKMSEAAKNVKIK